MDLAVAEVMSVSTFKGLRSDLFNPSPAFSADAAR
jgi:hypothetical protein